MPHHNTVTWDEALRVKLQSEPYASMPQGSHISDCVQVQDPDTGDVVGLELGPGDRADDAVCELLNKEVAETTTPQMLVSGADLYNCIDEPELELLSAPVQAKINHLCTMASVDLSPGTRARNLLNDSFDETSKTYAKLQALLAQFVPTPIYWWQSIGSNTPLNRHDLQRARTP